MDDDKRAKEYLEFVRAINSDWTIPDKEDDIGVDNAFTGSCKRDRHHTPRERKRRRRAVKTAIRRGGDSASGEGEEPPCRE